MAGSCCMKRLLFPGFGNLLEKVPEAHFHVPLCEVFLTYFTKLLTKLFQFFCSGGFKFLRHFFRRRVFREEFLHGVVQDGACGRRQELIVVQLEVLSSREGLLDLEHVGIFQTLFSALDHGDARAVGGDDRLVLNTGQVLDEVNGFGFGVLADGKTVTTTDDIGACTSATLNFGETEQTEVLNTLRIGGVSSLRGGSPLSGKFHSSLAVAKSCLHVIVGSTQETILEGLEVNQFLELCASFDEAR